MKIKLGEAALRMAQKTAREMSPEDWEALRFEATQSFSPSAPLNEVDLFAGRSKELGRMTEAVSERGKHVILFGERGVGKTSLSKLFYKLFPSTIRHIVSIREQADPGDDFSSLWRKVFRDISVQSAREDGTLESRPVADWYAGTITPDDVRRELESLFKPTDIPIIIIDEFDKIKDPMTPSMMANTIKYLSDYSVNCTVVLVGVADNVNELVGEHESIPRALEQIPMPRMSPQELKEVLEKIVPRLGMRIEANALWKIVNLARGLPSYVHALGLYAVHAAINRRSLTIMEKDVDDAIGRVLEKSEETVRDQYAKAVHSNRSDSLYKEVLLACALAQTDDRGTFAPLAVCEPLSGILKREKAVEISAFQQHLQKFITADRGEVLIRRGRERNYRYRFRDPMMQPYVIMRGIDQGFVDGKAIDILSFPEQPDLPM